MGKIEVKNKQRKINWILTNIGLSKRQFAGMYIIDISSCDPSEDEIRCFYEKFKKQISRPSASAKKIKELDDYIYYLEHSDTYKHYCNQRDVKCLEEIESLPPFKFLTGFISDYLILIADEKDTQIQKVLEVAVAYALSLGTAWNFQVIKAVNKKDPCDECRYLVIWEGDVGYSGGSGSWEPNICQVSESHWGSLYIENAEHMLSHGQFNTSLKSVEEIITYDDGVLTLVGYKYGEGDPNNHPSLKCQTKMQRNVNGLWTEIEERFLACVKH